METETTNKLTTSPEPQTTDPPTTDPQTINPRPRLSRDLVLHTALQLADRDGIQALSMRKLAQALGVEAMSLYHHVASKVELLDSLIDLVFAEIDLPAPGDDWRTALRARSIFSQTSVCRKLAAWRHPLALPNIGRKSPVVRWLKVGA